MTRLFAVGWVFVLSSLVVAQAPDRRVSLTVTHAAEGRASDLELVRETLLAGFERCRDVAARVPGDAAARFRLRVDARGVVVATSLAEGEVSAEARRWHRCAGRVLARARLAAGTAGTVDVVVAWTTEGPAGLGVSGVARGGGAGEGSVGRGPAGLGTSGVSQGSGAGEGSLGTLSGVGSPPSGPGISVRALVPEVSGSLSRDMVRRVVRRHLNQVRYCYEVALRQTPGLEGEVRVSFTIAADGSVSGTTVVANTVGSPEVAACIASRPRTWLFPQPEGGGTVVVSQTFVFEPRS